MNWLLIMVISPRLLGDDAPPITIPDTIACPAPDEQAEPPHAADLRARQTDAAARASDSPGSTTEIRLGRFLGRAPPPSDFGSSDGEPSSS